MDRSKKQWKTIDEYIETFPKDATLKTLKKP